MSERFQESSNTDQTLNQEEKDLLRSHVFDGIQEFDKRLPNWWLWTLYGAIIYAVFYWIIGHHMGLMRNPGEQVTEVMKQNTLIAAKSSGVVSNEQLVQLSHDPQVVSAGLATVLSTCAACHKPDLSGAIGPSLIDNTWVHGGKPLDIMNTITNGVPSKGMPSWGPILGKTKITDVTAYILSLHKEVPAPAVTP